MNKKTNIQPRRRLLNLALLAALGGGALAPASASAADLYWACSTAAWGDACWSSTPGGAPALGPPNPDGDNGFQSTGSLSASAETIGYDGTGTFTQSGGTNTVSNFLTLGANSGSSGSYDLSGNSSLSAGFEFIGNSGTGTFTQSGGTNTVSNILYLGNGSGTGSYNLSVGSLGATRVFVGTSSSGNQSTFTQSGGSHTTSNLTVGLNSGSQGRYQLGGGNLAVNGDAIIGQFGTGAMVHNGGTNSVSNSLVLGQLAGGSGSYTLSGTGSLTAQYQYIGKGADPNNYAQFGGTTGNFIQTGGTNTATAGISLGSYAGSIGTYSLSGGSLTSNNFQTIGDYGTGIVVQTGGSNTTGGLTLGLNASGNGSYRLDAGTLTVGDALLGYLGSGTITQNGGTHTAGSLYFGISTGSGGYILNSGALSAGSEILQGGVIAQSGGTHTVSGVLNLGAAPGRGAFYTLSGGSLTTATAIVGEYGVGTFSQSAGSHVVSGNLSLGSRAGSSGTYNLNGGTLNVGSIANGAGTSTFNLDGGTLNLTGSSIGLDHFRIGNASGSNGSFTLGVGQTLTATNETIGVAGTGTFNQSGGTHMVGNTLFKIGGSVGSNGTYNLSGGDLLVAHEVVGFSGTGTFNQSGGTHTVTSGLTIAATNGGPGTYNLTGGALTVNGLFYNNTNGIFNVGTGATATVNGPGLVNHGLLGGGGTIVGNVASDGTVGPGNSPGTLSITGDYTQTMLGTFTAEIGGLLAGSQYDVLNVGGTATLDGLLNVVLFDLGVGLFAPHAGDYFDILAASTITGSFSTLSFATLSDPNLFWQINYLTDAIGTTDVVRLSVASNIAPPPAVPEPETYAMLLAGLGLLGFAGRNRKNRAA